MTSDESSFVAAAGVRRILVGAGDIRAEIEFQNDINGILARLDDVAATAVAVGAMPDAEARPQPRTLRIIRGGVTSARPAAVPPPFLASVARSA
jgi:hypothetical protein